MILTGPGPVETRAVLAPLLRLLPNRGFKSQLCHSRTVGLPGNYRWKISLHLFSGRTSSARTRMPWPRPCKGGSSPALTRRGVGLPIGAHLWAQDPHPWNKRRGWAGSEEKPGLRTSVLVHTRIFHAPAWTLTHVVQIKRPTYKHTHSTGHCLPQLHRSPPPRYINSPCPPVSPAITYLILGY